VHAHDRAAAAELVVSAPEHDLPDTHPPQRASAHDARLDGHVPAAERRGRSGDGRGAAAAADADAVGEVSQRFATHTSTRRKSAIAAGTPRECTRLLMHSTSACNVACSRHHSQVHIIGKRRSIPRQHGHARERAIAECTYIAQLAGAI